MEGALLNTELAALTTPQTGLGPRPPIEMSTNETMAWAFTIFCFAMFAAVLVWSLWMLARRREPLPLALLVGGAMCSLLEPMADANSLVWYPTDTPLILFHGWGGRPIPSWVTFGEGMFFAMAGWGAYRLFLAGRPVRSLLVLMGAFSAFDALMEMVCIQSGLWVYYGDNPSRIFGLPSYALVQNGALAVVTGWIAIVAAPHMRGARWLLIPALIPCAFLAQAMATTWFVYTGLNSDTPHGVMWVLTMLATVTNFALAYGLLRSEPLERLRRGSGSRAHPVRAPSTEAPALAFADAGSGATR